jgi:hypothetical protein
LVHSRVNQSCILSLLATETDVVQSILPPNAHHDKSDAGRFSLSQSDPARKFLGTATITTKKNLNHLVLGPVYILLLILHSPSDSPGLRI